jgi:protein-S-isoprenylcysteine O-methyltransferase Ste14
MHIWLVVAITILVCGVNGRLRDLGDPCWYIAIACWAAIDLYWGWTARHLPCASQPPSINWRTRAIGFLPYVLYCLPLGAVPVLGQRLFPKFEWLEAAGAVMCVVGAATAIWSRNELADLWNSSVSPSTQRTLVQKGPYAIVRHPIYAGMILTMLAMMLVLGEVRALILAFGIEALLRKLRSEDALLAAAFPGEFPAYQVRVKRLVPWIW